MMDPIDDTSKAQIFFTPQLDYNVLFISDSVIILRFKLFSPIKKILNDTFLSLDLIKLLCLFELAK